MRATFRRTWLEALVACNLAGGLLTTDAAAWVRDGTPLCTQGSVQSVPSIALDGAGGAIVGWVDGRSSPPDLYAQAIDSTGSLRWSANGIAVCAAPGGQFGPVLLPSSGGAVAFWRDQRLGTSNFDVYGQRLDGAGNPVWTINGIPLATTLTNATVDLAAISDNNSGIVQPPGWIVAWRRGVSGFVGIQVQHVDATGAGLWSSPSTGGVPLASPVLASIGSIAMTTDGTGIASASKGAVVAWSQDQGGVTGSDIYARRVNGGGVPQWSQAGVALCAIAGEQDQPDIVHVGGGNTVTVWRDGRTSDVDLYAQKINNSGALQWPDSGVAVCRGPGTVNLPKLTFDGAGGAIVVWEDYRSGTAQIYAQRLDGAGQPQWDLGGIPVSPTTAAQATPQVVSDGAGGAIVVWVDLRAGSDLFAQRLDPSGIPLWLPSGVPLSSSGTQLTAFDITGNGSSGILAAWVDSRNGNPDVFANRVVASGGVVGVGAPRPPRELRLAWASPNPTRGGLRLTLELPTPVDVDAHVFDAGGRHVRSLATGARLGAGSHELAWDARDEKGDRMPAGIYFLRVQAGGNRRVLRIVTLH